MVSEVERMAMSEFDEKIRERKLFKGVIGTRLNRTNTIENRRIVDGYGFQVRMALPA
jgi:hypothetical protein